jgi:arylsulfatase A-like enzyme
MIYIACSQKKAAYKILHLLVIAISNMYVEGKPNIIVILTDDLGYYDIANFNNASSIITPNIDLLVKGGALLSNGYVTAPQCAPSRIGLITGQYQNKLGLEGNLNVINSDSNELYSQVKTIPKLLHDAGYVSGMAGKSHFGKSDDSGVISNQIGFDKVFVKHNSSSGHWNMNLLGRDIYPQKQIGGYHLEMCTEFACAFIEKYRSQPFFFYVSYRAPHVPLDPPDVYIDRIEPYMPERRRKALAMLSCVDDGVGRILTSLRKHNIEENTLIFFISDNGAPLKLYKFDNDQTWPGWNGSINDPLNGEKGMLTEGGIRVPFVAYWKGTIPSGQVFSQPVITLDVAATVTALAGLSKPPEFDGVNLIPYLTGNLGGPPHRRLFWRWFCQSAVRVDNWKYLRTGSREYLFDLNADQKEKTNLIKIYPLKARDLLSDLEDWAVKLDPPGTDTFKTKDIVEKYYNWYLYNSSDQLEIQETSVIINKELSKGFWSDANPIANTGWFHTPVGIVYLSHHYYWAYHLNLGWIYAHGTSLQGAWIWIEDRGWHWTSLQRYPYFYSNDLYHWINFVVDA